MKCRLNTLPFVHVVSVGAPPRGGGGGGAGHDVDANPGKLDLDRVVMVSSSQIRFNSFFGLSLSYF